MTGWTEREYEEYRKRQGQSGPQDVRRKATEARTERESRSRWQNTVSDAYAAQEGIRHNHGEEAFVNLFKQCCSGVRFPFVRQYGFRAGRGWKLDFYDPATRIGIEISGRAHIAGLDRLAQDFEKANACAEDGITLLYYTPEQIEGNPRKVFAQILDLLEKKRGEAKE